VTLYDVKVALVTRYGAPAAQGRHIARVLPRDVPGVQRVERRTLRLGPGPDERWEREDFFGNGEVEFAFRVPHRRVEVRMEARVERLADAQPPRSATPIDRLPGEIAAVRDLGPASPLHFLAPSPMVPREPEIAAWASARSAGAGTAWDVAAALSGALHREMTFDGKATEVDTPPLEAFRKRRGVCQDLSHILITALRAVGVPAGYVSGLIRTIPPEGRPRLEGADAMHAWVMAWCGAGAGWVELDPTNDCLAGRDHILVARGRDYSDVSPVKGIMRIAGRQRGSHAVDVIPVEA
jgi:transglutaminase-like putative cysteine protease